MRKQQVVLVEMQAPCSGSEHSLLLTPTSKSANTSVRKASKRPTCYRHTPDYVLCGREGSPMAKVHRPTTGPQTSGPQARESSPRREHRGYSFGYCNNKFHPCHHKRRHRSPRDRKNISFDLLQPPGPHPEDPLTAKSSPRERRTPPRRQVGEGQVTRATGSALDAAQGTWRPGNHGDAKRKKQSPFISGNAYNNIPDTKQEYIPINIEDYLSARSDGGVMSTTTRQLTMLTALKDRANCLGGWSFLVLALGAVVFLPATLFTGLYLKHTGFLTTEHRANPLRIIGLSFFSLSILLISIGIGICIVWMRFSSDNRSRPGSPVKAPFQKDMGKESLQTTEPSAEEYELGMPNATKKEETSVYPSTSKEDGWSEEQNETLPLSVV